MKKNLFYVCAIAMATVAMTSCRSSRSSDKAFNAVYNQAMADREATTTTVTPTQQANPIEVTPVQNTTVVATPITNDATVQQETVTLINGSGLKAYSVVVGSFGVQANAERLQADLKKSGYDAQIVYNAEKDKYRVVATTFNDRASAVQSRDALRTSVNAGAWLLYAK